MLDDAFLREFGFAIAERPVGKAPRWRDLENHRVMEQELAMSIASHRKANGAEARSIREEREAKAREQKESSSKRYTR